MKENSPTFIVGPGRSGTSLLYRILQKHPVFKTQNCPAGVDLTESNVFCAPRAVYDKTKTQGVGAYSYMLFNDTLFSEFVSKLRWTVRWQRMLGTSVLPGGYNFFTRRLLRNRCLRVIFWRLYQGPTMARSFFAIAKNARGVERLLEKTPLHLQRIPEIMYTYPESQIIGLIRHPIDIFTSYRRRYEVERQTGASADQLAWLHVTPKQFCARYTMDEGIIRREKSRNDGRFLCVRYEDLTRNPQETLRTILIFLGERYEEQCVVKDETDRLYWEIDPHLFDQIRVQTKDWREYIELEQAEYIEVNLKQPMEQLGYERYT